MIIKKNELEDVILAMLAFVKSEVREEIDIDMDMYRFISDEDWVRFDKDPDYLIGSIKDDWRSINGNIGSGGVTYLDLERLANILKAVGSGFFD